ncbi:arylsulfatase [Methanosarcina sp. 2.H.T.1A.6]|uniref:arylsulfatase n=1 Tax=unclassified Methanosarcina TaxID=2644672 RepID=UPI0006213EFA|nr:MULTISPECIES: arylsulfatase [unclassified Methanosarcina]KKG13927.1 arylsulfatase [Methanosarcina sp. 2.H.T.1A.3]KKG19125.1 arylsulfatase [Methanosarcina sp. 2.H.T.1A.15]KKG25118.1 arylsulfatase [Methanosarcina sp. 2.H.T.1A.6]KKG27021.1 arylsulfatase [Methanosarcina sp. 2.H.T.1A.8]
MPLKEYKPGTTFPGVIGRTADQSEPAWPEPNRAKEGTPNVLFIVLDDTGFGQLGCYGSPINTPNLDSLAEGGLVYNNMHTTALCSPTRTCILTGRNHHSNNMACITEGSTGYPGYNGYIPFENGFLSEILLEHGYNTYAVGKWHLTPADQISAAGPYDRWPLGRGFERFYGFLGGETHQYYPELVYDSHSVHPPKTPEEGYTLNEDLADKAIQFIADAKQVAPNKPFFMYFCTGAMHAPHHVPKEWADKYKGKFNDGWEAYREKTFARQKELGIVPEDAELSRHDPDVKPWDECSPEEKKLYARMMEVFAGFLEHTDYHTGRLLQFLKDIGEFDNTLIMVISDNGASSEGGPTGSVNENLFFNNVPESLEENLAALNKLGGPETYNHYAWGWTWAGDTPFRRWKRETYRGGISDPFIVHWPRGIMGRGEARAQYAHAIDMVPTVLECLRIEPPTVIKGVTQAPIEGFSFADSFDNAGALSKHHTQYFEMMGHRSIYHDGWRAVCPWPGPSFTEAGKSFGEPIPAGKLTELDAKGWELYHVEKDWTESHNMAAENRSKLIEMIATWYVEAGKYNVLPIDARGVLRLADERPQIAAERTHYTYYPGTQVVPMNAAVRVLNRPHSITADVEIPPGGAEGVLLAHGGIDGGYSFYIKGKKLHWVHNYVSRTLYHVESVENVPEGRHKLRFEFEVTGKPDVAKGKGAPGRAQLYIDGKLVGQVEVPVTTPIIIGLTSGVTCGSALGAPVTPDYRPPFEFTGKIYSVTVDVSGKLIEDKEAEIRMVMARQ